MGAPDEIIHQKLRLEIMAALRVEPGDGRIEFRRLKSVTGATDGNLGRQLTTLEEAGYIEITKEFHEKRPRPRAKITGKGAAAFDGHVAYLESLLPGLQG